jgi:uncharacterized protein (TIGR02001 family)
MGATRRHVLLMAGLVARVAHGGITLDDFGGSLGLTSDDIYHGISYTCGDPAAQADVHYRSSGGLAQSEFFAGAWVSGGIGESRCGRSRELNEYAGYSLAMAGDTSAVLTYTHYGYPGGSYTLRPTGGARYDYDALEVQWAWQDLVSVTAAWTPDAFRFTRYSLRSDRTALSYGLQLHHPLPAGFSLSAGIGYDEIEDPSSAGYGYWSAGVGYAVGPVQLQADYVGTSTRADHQFGSYVAGDRGSFSAIWRF